MADVWRYVGYEQMTQVAHGAIALRVLTKLYGDQTVVDQVSAEVDAGQFFSLLGPSGSGKTSTLMMLAGFSTPSAGSIMLDGVDITHLSPQERGLGMVFQNYALFPHLSVHENVAFPLQVRKMRKPEIAERVKWALDVVRLGEFASRLPRSLSGGQQQRVALARAIVFHPRVVLMDEPLGALDKNLRYHMQVELKEIQQRLNMTVVYVTHDQEEAMNMSDQIAIMNRGRIEQVGTPREVYENPKTAFVARFLGEANLIGPGAQISGAKTGELLFVRPERVRLSRERVAEAGAVQLRGRVERVSFLGSLVRYTVALGDGATVSADQQNTCDDEHFQVGEPVEAWWRAADGRVLADA